MYVFPYQRSSSDFLRTVRVWEWAVLSNPSFPPPGFSAPGSVSLGALGWAWRAGSLPTSTLLGLSPGHPQLPGVLLQSGSFVLSALFSVRFETDFHSLPILLCRPNTYEELILGQNVLRAYVVLVIQHTHLVEVALSHAATGPLSCRWYDPHFIKKAAEIHPRPQLSDRTEIAPQVFCL